MSELTVHTKLLGNGSLSSGSSIVTISSAAISDPDPEAPGDNNGPNGKRRNVLEERWQHTALQVSVPFFIAGIGTIGAGLVLARVEVNNSMYKYFKIRHQLINIRMNPVSSF